MSAVLLKNKEDNVKKKYTVETKIALTLTVIVIVTALIVGLVIVFGVGVDLLNEAIVGLNGPDLQRMASLFGLFGIIVLAMALLFYIIIGVGIFIAPIWIIWGIVKLIRKSTNSKKV